MSRVRLNLGPSLSQPQTVHTHPDSVHQAAKLVAVLLRAARVTAGLAERSGSLPPGLWLTSPAGWLPRTGISSGTVRSIVEYRLTFYCLRYLFNNNNKNNKQICIAPQGRKFRGAVRIPGIFFWRGGGDSPPPAKNLQFLHNGCQIVWSPNRGWGEI